MKGDMQEAAEIYEHGMFPSNRPLTMMLTVILSNRRRPDA